MSGAPFARAPGLLPLIALTSLACGSLIGLGDLDKAECGELCGGQSGAVGGETGTVGSGGSGLLAGASSVAGGAATAGSGGAGIGFGGTGSGVAGTMPTVGGTATGGSGGAGGEAGEPAAPICPGGPEPPLNWTEHWFEHNQVLTRVYYDDCVALYFDGDVAPAAKDWLASFISRAWSYSLATYGKMGEERVYAVVHQGRYGGGHVALAIDDTHDHRNVIDMGSTSWAEGKYDLPAHLLGFVVDSSAAHTKFESPKGAHYGNVGFPLIYKYDLFLGLGLDATAATSLVDYNAAFNDKPFAGTYWFRDWLLPIWRDHGHAQVFANYQSLLEKYYPADSEKRMPTMNYGQYFHFMSGAAGVDLVPLAREAFEWHADFDEEVASAKADFSAIKY